MPGMLTDYTTYATVRAMLGVNDIELPDATLALPMYSLMVDDGLRELNSAVPTNYATIKAMTPPTSRSNVQARYFEQVGTYAAVLAAQAALPALPLAAPVRVEDGRAAMERTANPFDALAASLATLKAILAGRVLATLGLVDGSAVIATKTARVFAASIPLAVDPVTGA